MIIICIETTIYLSCNKKDKYRKFIINHLKYNIESFSYIKGKDYQKKSINKYLFTTVLTI